jgi:hypothetical protein
VNEQPSRVTYNAMRTFAIMAAGILLNLGLFFILVIGAPLVVGVVCGYIVGDRKNGIIASVLSSIIAYALIFTVTGYATDIPAFVTAILIMCVIGAVGAIVGAYVQQWMVEAEARAS